MRLLQIVPEYSSYRVFLSELCHSAVTAGHEVTVACGRVPPDAHADLDASVPIVPLDLPRGMNLVGHLRASRALRRLLLTSSPDIVHAHFSAGLFTTAIALRQHDPWISFGTFQGLSFPLSRQPRKAVLRAAEVLAARPFDHVFVLTADDLAALRRASPGARVELQPGYGFGCADRFVDTPRATCEQRRALRRVAALPDDAPVLIFVGRLVAFKGFDFAVRAFWGLQQVLPEAHLVVVGDVDPLHPTGLSPTEWRRFQSDGAILRAGPQRDVLPWLDLSDLMIFPTTREGMPVCVMEALARGLPVMTAPVRGCRELVLDGYNGFLLPSRAEATWVGRMSIALAQRRRAPRAVIGQDACDHLRRSRWVNSTLAAYEEAHAGMHMKRPRRRGALSTTPRVAGSMVRVDREFRWADDR